MAAMKTPRPGSSCRGAGHGSDVLLPVSVEVATQINLLGEITNCSTVGMHAYYTSHIHITHSCKLHSYIIIHQDTTIHQDDHMRVLIAQEQICAPITYLK